MSNIKITHPGGASARFEKDSSSKCILPRNAVYSLDKLEGDYYRVLVPMYVHANSCAEIHEHPYTPSMIPWETPPLEETFDALAKDGAYMSIKMFARFCGVKSSAELKSYDDPEKVYNALTRDGVKCELGMKYFPEPPYIAWVNYGAIRMLQGYRKTSAYLLVLAMDEHYVTAHDSLDTNGSNKRIPINDFLLAYRGTSIWLQ